MLEFEKKQYEIDHLYGGRKDRTSTAKERVEITLKYNRQYLSNRFLFHSMMLLNIVSYHLLNGQ